MDPTKPPDPDPPPENNFSPLLSEINNFINHDNFDAAISQDMDSPLTPNKFPVSQPSSIAAYVTIQNEEFLTPKPPRERKRRGIKRNSSKRIRSHSRSSDSTSGNDNTTHSNTNTTSIKKTGPGSRSRTRDHDSRPHQDHKDKYKSESGRNRSRSREDEDRYDRQARNRSRSPESEPHRGRINEDKSWGDRSDGAPPPPPPAPKISKISIGFSKPAAAPIKMSLGGPVSSAAVAASSAGAANSGRSKPNVASVFNTSDDDDEPEEMPAEARMRMRNIGRETPTSAGPNSFGKTKHGFCDAKKVFEKTMKEAMDASDPKAPKPAPKFPQTVYKINNTL